LSRIAYAAQLIFGALNERSKRIRKQTLLEIQIGDYKVGHGILLALQLLTDAIFGQIS